MYIFGRTYLVMYTNITPSQYPGLTLKNRKEFFKDIIRKTIVMTTRKVNINFTIHGVNVLILKRIVSWILTNLNTDSEVHSKGNTKHPQHKRNIE